MRRITKGVVAGALLVGVLVAEAPSVGAASTWVPERPDFAPHQFTPAVINDAGFMAGYAFVGEVGVSESDQAAAWDPVDGFAPIGVLPGGVWSWATAVNELGTVVGESEVLDGSHAFIWDRTVGLRDLGVLAGATGNDASRATDVNDAGLVVGSSYGPSGQERPFLWTEADGMVELPTPPGTVWGRATAVNDAGVAVGYAFDGDTVLGLVWSSGGYAVLPSLPGTLWSTPADINDSGWIVGKNDLAGVLWHPTDGLVELGLAPGGYTVTDPTAINEHGVIVGYTYVHAWSGESRPPDRGIVWENGTLAVLDGLAGDHSVWDINSSDVVIGQEWGTTSEGSFELPIRWSRQTDPGDTTPPVLSLPADLPAEATGPDGAVVDFAASATDDVDGTVPVVCDPASGSTFPLGATEVECTATDAAGNIANGSFTVTVSDTTGPVLELPDDIEVYALSPDGAEVTFTVTAIDAVDGPVPAYCTPHSRSVFPIGDTTVSCRAADRVDNSSNGEFTVTVLNWPPFGDGVAIEAVEDQLPVPITLSGFDFNGDALTYRVTGQPTLGMLSGSPPNLTYTLRPNACGWDVFTFVVNDGRTDSEPAGVGIQIACVNDPPTASPVRLTVPEGTVEVPVQVNGSDVDGDPLVYTLSHDGSVIGRSSTGSFEIGLYLQHFFGVVTYDVAVCDNRGACTNTTAQVTWTPVPDLPYETSVWESSRVGRRACINQFQFREPDRQPTSNFTVRVAWGDGVASQLSLVRRTTLQTYFGYPYEDHFEYRGCHTYPAPPKGKSRTYRATIFVVDARDGTVKHQTSFTIYG